jgi:secondary thiamine-phosphate synthase enzyme
MEMRVRITTNGPTEFIDITDRIQTLVRASGVRVGIVNVQALHTTTGVVVNEHEPLLLTDFASTLDKAAPSDGRYRHDDATVRTVNVTARERANGHAHCRALLLGVSASLNIVDGTLLLGRWQRVFFAELDGPQERVISAVILGESRS